MYHVFYYTDGDWVFVMSTRDSVTRDLVLAALRNASYTAW